MKLAMVVGLVAIVAASVVLAQETQGHLRFSKINDRADLAALLPPRAAAEKIGGEARIKCVVTVKGELSECAVVSESPAGYGFGEAALKAALKERVRPKDDKGQTAAGRSAIRQFSFLAPGDADPDWLRMPTPDELASVYPVVAMKEGLDGRAVIACGVTPEGFLANCKVASEAPAGKGFGSAALALSPQFRMTPKVRDGKPVAASVNIPVVWKGMKAMKSMEHGPGRIRIVLDPPWAAVATAEDVRAAWPVKSKEKAATAAVRCRLSNDGDVKLCDVTSENPRGQGFGKAAQKLAEQKFKVQVSEEGAKLGDYSVDIPFRFRNPAEPDTRRITQPKWITALSPESVALVFPKAATARGLSQGRGIIDCLVTATGALTDCKPVSEEPADLGFGQAALAAADYMTMNPWSVDGDPLDGLRVTLPIRLQLVDETPKDAATPAP